MTESQKQRPMVVIIDDDKLILSLVSQILQREFEVLTFETSQSAQAAITSRPPDLAITDMYMPGDGGGGRELMDWLRRHHPNIPIIAVSGGDPSASDRPGAAIPGASITLAKPFRAAAILAAVRQALGPRQPG